MRAEPFSLDDTKRVQAHPDSPAAYVEWVEFLALTGLEDRTHLGNVLGWSGAAARTPLGASRATFRRALPELDEDLMDRWMCSLAATPVEDFIDHHVPFLRNASTMTGDGVLDRAVAAFLDIYLQPNGRPHPLPKLEREAPDSVILEITRSCNFACTMCSSRTAGFLPDRTMTLPVFGEMVRVLAPGARSLRINGYGETTLVPNLPEYLDCLDEFRFGGVREIITNLSAEAAVYEDLYARGFVILASWDATSSALFERIRVGARFEGLKESLVRVGRCARGQPERLGLLATIQECNADEIVPLVHLAAQVGAGLIIYNMVKEPNGSPWMDERFDELRERFDEAGRTAAQVGVALRIPDHIGTHRLRLPTSHRSSATFCDRPWRELLVRYDTEATVCNMFNPYSYGVLSPPGPPRDVPHRFGRLWNGPNARLFRELINTDDSHPYCRGCYFLHG
jgi:MoaA/NifB/PqqE/SkfB family radical SAM enzyme